jgi:AraC-like DNA-binding protein
MAFDQSSFSQILDCKTDVAVGGHWILRNTHNRLSPLHERRSQKRVTHPHTAVTRQVYASAHEDVARLGQILRVYDCSAVMRGSDGVELPLDTAALRGHGDASMIELPGRESGASRTVALSAPVYGANGCLLATLEVTSHDSDRSDSSLRLLRALLEAAARAITERWFRLVHRRDWVIAAMRRKAPDTCILLALDREQRLLGADRRARELLGARGRSFAESMRLSELFQPNVALLRRRGYHDVSSTLFAPGNEDPWIALITPPDIGAAESCHDARAVLHARPRLDSLGHLWAVSTMSHQRAGLPRESCKLIEDYIDTHLDTALELHKLAALVGMSPSHFTRSFHKAFGLTPHRYVIQCRILRARELLASTQLPLTEIALTVGFADQSHFCRRFTEGVGVTPGAFRGSTARPRRRPTSREGAAAHCA